MMSVAKVQGSRVKSKAEEKKKIPQTAWRKRWAQPLKEASLRLPHWHRVTCPCQAQSRKAVGRIWASDRVGREIRHQSQVEMLNCSFPSYFFYIYHLLILTGKSWYTYKEMDIYCTWISSHTLKTENRSSIFSWTFHIILLRYSHSFSYVLPSSPLPSRHPPPRSPPLLL